MSCKYYLIDTEKDTIRKEVAQLISTVKDNALTELALAKRGNARYPAISATPYSEPLDTFIQEFTRMMDNAIGSVDWDEAQSLGNHTRIGFRWDSCYNICSLEALTQYLEQNPQVRIRDEYDKEFTLQEFIKEVGL